MVPLLLCGGLAQAQDAFEIQVYDAETAAPGETGLEVHTNHVVSDAAATHLTLEPHLGIADWFEIGGYFQTAVDGDGTFRYAGVKLRAKARLARRLWDDRLGVAVNVELSAIPERYEDNVWGTEVRPILDLTVGRLYVSVNPIITVDLRGDLAGHPQLEPSAKLAVNVVGTLSLGIESYSAFGPIDDLGSERVERLLGAVDWTSPWVDVNVGAGYAWGTPDHVVVKAIFGVHPP